MIDFQRRLSAGEIISPKSFTLMREAHMAEGGGMPSFYGYGIVVDNHPRFGNVYWHNGGSKYFSANLSDFTDQGLVVFTASNSVAFDADSAGSLIAKALLNQDRKQ